MGRINAWNMAFNLAKDKPLGGGLIPSTWLHVRPVRAGSGKCSRFAQHLLRGPREHGFVGLALFFTLGLMTWRSGSWVINQGARGRPHNRWLVDLAAHGAGEPGRYASAGAFLGLAYFDFYYTLIAVIVLCKIGIDVSQECSEGAELTGGAVRAEASTGLTERTRGPVIEEESGASRGSGRWRSFRVTADHNFAPSASAPAS